MVAYWLLIGMILMFTGIGGVLIFRRRKEFPRPAVQHDYYSREFALFLGASAIVAAAVFIVVGTSSPIITDILHGKKSAVDISYYVTTTLPLGIAIGILAGVGQLLWWTRSDRKELWSSLRTPLVISAIGTGVLVALGVREILVGLFLFGAAFALCANIAVAWKIFKGNPKYAGGSVAHIGVAIMFVGFAASSKYDDKQTVSLTQGQPMEALGYTLTYTGSRKVEGEKYAFQVRVQKDGKEYTVAPIMYYSSYNDGLMRNPDIANLITKDFYLAPLSLEQKTGQGAPMEKVELKRGEVKKLGDLEITFVGFDFPVMQKAAMLEGKDVRIGAKLAVKQGDDRPVTVSPGKIIAKGETRDEPAKLGDRYEFVIAGMSPDREAKENSRVEIGVRALDRPSDGAGAAGDILVAEASVKPYINLVWTGVIILLVGFLVTIVRRSQEAALGSVPVE
jgi:cytochrome c-type biogenesis protein CcmF